MDNTWTITIPNYEPKKLVTKVRKPDTPKSNLQGFVKDYKKLYETVKAMNEGEGSMYSLGKMQSQV